MKNLTKVLMALAIVFTLSFFAWGVVRIVNEVDFNINCTQYIKRAADANTIETAKEELKKAITYAEENNLTEGIVSIFFKQPKNDVGFWYKNMKESYSELENLPSDATALEKTNVLMKLRETLTDEKDSGVSVTIPAGISVYPNNALYFWWACISAILACVMWVLTYFLWNEYCY